MHKPKYAMFFDNHTMAACPDVGSDFNADEFSKRVKDCGVDLVGFVAKCNQGFCYYDTKIGIKHPSLKRDMFGEMVAACKEKGIAVTAYLNCGLSNEDAIRHMDWCTLNPKGKIYQPEIFDLGDWVSPYMRTMCVNSPYRDYLLSMILEVAHKYPVTGFLLDSFNGFSCICPTCIKEMKENGINWRDESELKKFARFSVLRLAEDIKSALNKISRDYLCYFLGIGTVDNIRIGSYLECECLPTFPSWGYDYLPIMSHHFRTLAGDNRPILNMTGRFYAWGDFGSLRPQAGIEYDFYYGIANGMRPNIGGHIHPRGSTQGAIFDRIQTIYSKMQLNEEWYTDAGNLTDIAVLSMEVGKTPPLIGITRMLSELKMQFDIIRADADFSRYKLLIMPDEILLSPETAAKVKAFIASGNAVISTGCSGLDLEKKDFVLKKEWGIKYIGECPFDPSFFQPMPQLKNNLPEIPLSLYKRGIEISVDKSTEVAAVLIKSYFNREWDGVYSNFYLPPDKVTELPLVTFNGKVAHIGSPIFSAYHELAAVDLRTLFANVLSRLLPEPLLKVSGLPSFGKATITAQPGRRMVHLINYVPELRGKSEIVEEPLFAKEIKVSLLVDDFIPKSAYLAPDRKRLELKREGNYVSVVVPEMCGYQLLALE